MNDTAADTTNGHQGTIEDTADTTAGGEKKKKGTDTMTGDTADTTTAAEREETNTNTGDIGAKAAIRTTRTVAGTAANATEGRRDGETSETRTKTQKEHKKNNPAKNREPRNQAKS